MPIPDIKFHYKLVIPGSECLSGGIGESVEYGARVRDLPRVVPRPQAFRLPVLGCGVSSAIASAYDTLPKKYT